LDPVTAAKVDAIGYALAHARANQEKFVAAAELAKAQLELLRIRKVRTQVLIGFVLE
jgi:hypothetical protein